MLPITAFAHSVNADYTFIKEINVNGVVYRCYRVSANWGRNAEYSKYLGTAARIKSLTGVQSSEFVIPASVYDGDQEYAVEGFSQYFVDTNGTITKLVFEGPVGMPWIGKEAGSFYVSLIGYERWIVSGCNGESTGEKFDIISLPNLRSLYIPNTNIDGTAATWSFQYFTNLRDVYFTDCFPTLSEGMFTNAGNITVHIQPQYIKESLKNSSVWCNFKAIEPYYVKHDATFTNNGANQLHVYSTGKLSYSEAVAQNKDYLLQIINPKSSGDVSFKVGENYYLQYDYDATNCNMPKLTRNGEEVTLVTPSAGEAGYSENNVQEKINYVMEDSHKQCHLHFNVTGTYKAGTYQIVQNGQTVQGNINTTQNVYCDYGTQVTLTIPATPYLLNNSLSLRKVGSTTTTQNITLPTPVDGSYTITFDVPSVGFAYFNYAYNIPAVVNTDPVITLMRMGEGEVKLTKFWEWGEQDEAYRNTETINCINPSTSVIIPLPSNGNKGWGYRLEVTPLKGQKLRNLLVGYIMPEDNEGKERIYWGDYLNWTSYDTTTNTYTFTVDMEQGGGDVFGMEDYNILVDMGPEHTIVEEGYKQSIVCKGSTQSKGRLTGETETEFSCDGAVNLILDDKSEYDHFLTINLANGEKFIAYRDGVDVTNRFDFYNGAYHYEFFASDFYASGWTIIFEKDENVVTNYDWTVMLGNNVGGYISAVYPAATMNQYLLSPVDTYSISAGQLTETTLNIYGQEGMPLLVMCDGENLSDQAEFNESAGVYTITTPAAEMFSHTWYVDYPLLNAKPTWTVVHEADVEDVQIITTAGGDPTITNLTAPCTAVIIDNAVSATLKVHGTISTTYDLYLDVVGSNKIQVINAVREIASLGLNEAKALVESAPVKVKGFATRAEAEAGKATLEAVGATCSIKDPGTSLIRILHNGVDITNNMTNDGDYLSITVDADDLATTTWVITSEENFNRYDVNRDGDISIADVTKLVNKILGKE
jgi:ribosomal protein L7/L12